MPADGKRLTLITNTKSATVIAEIRRLLRSSDHARWAVSYWTRSGVRALRDDLESFVKRGGVLDLLISGDGWVTEPAALDELRKIGVRRILFKPPRRGGEFHAKVLHFDNSDGGRNAALVGSANISGGGVSKNIEAVLSLEGTPNDRHLRSIRRRVDELFGATPGALPLTDSILEAYRHGWEMIEKRREFKTKGHERRIERAAGKLGFGEGESARLSPNGPHWFLHTMWPGDFHPPLRNLAFQSKYGAPLQRLALGSYVFTCELTSGNGETGVGGVCSLSEVVGEPRQRKGGSFRIEDGRRFRFDRGVAVRPIVFVRNIADAISLTAAKEILGYRSFRFRGGLSRPLDPDRCQTLYALLNRRAEER